ncbi:hypothetical protein TeGR_g4460, partial [Tetraparma gracilis]
MVADDFHLGLDLDVSTVKFGDQIGRGTFGQVFKGHVKDGQGGMLTCAVKQLFLEGTQDEMDEIVTDFRKECLILDSLRHPNIIKFYGATQTPPQLCMITELCEGNVVDLLELVGAEKIN